MEVTLTGLRKQVDVMIDARITRISFSAYKKANFLPSGKKRKKYVPYTLPQEVNELLELKQALYSGGNPENIASILTSGSIQDKFLKS